MGKKKRAHPDVEELLARPWCYYCEREFEDLKLLISHQKAKHFKCERCGKRLNTAGGLSVHMNQVHKESLNCVENALPNRQALDIEIFGVEGIPEDILQQHNQRIIQNYYTAQAERRAATGNPPPGQSRGQGPAKKIKQETPDELKQRLAAHRAKLAAQKAAAANGTVIAPEAQGQSPGQGVSANFHNPLIPGSAADLPGSRDLHQISPFPPPQPGFPYLPPGGIVPGGVPGVPSYSPSQTYPPSYPPGPSPPPGASGAFNLPARPPSNPPVTSALPQRPPYYYNGHGNGTPTPAFPRSPSTVDDLVVNAGRGGDDIDQLIRMAEAGIKPQQQKNGAAEDGAAGEKKSKKDKEKNTRMIYGDSEISPEEKMIAEPRYRFVAEVA
ncbi:hypothetical protein B0H63DRAFT_522765 [Podospora didyma]|uniref:BUB3-interacting and GLEBS motif-containing protein n=1 Tax=Podospora didyma TaxID=330526 RepID=A0AAE0TZJ6_9PEZI|nr:hypothetical protein B0H63DRAFT_522765 [Podospora didyma]